MSDTENRAAYISGLHKFADWLEQHPEIPLPYTGRDPDAGRLNFIPFGDQENSAAAFARAFPKPVDKTVRDKYFDLQASFDGFHVNVIFDRDQVCRRVVVGTREVTKLVKDPKRVAEIPEVEVTDTEEIVEWVCGSVLAPARDQAELDPAMDGGA